MEIIELYKSKKVKLGDGNTTNDIISELCDDTLIMILDFLTLKEAVRTSVLSRRWQQLWQFFSGSFSFEASYSRDLNKEKLKTERSRFVGRINKVLNSHQVSTILELRVSFDLGKHSKSYVDEWIGIALKKKVKKLELAFKPYFTSYHKLLYTCYRISKESFSCFTTSSGSPGTLFLTCLSLQYVGVSDEIVEYILSSCPMLESLHVRMSPLLRDPKVTGSSLRLKHLNIQSCEFVQSIEVCAPNLASFEYYGKEIPLHVRYAPKLHEVYYFDPLNYSIPHAFSQLANYLPQLVSLTLNMSFDWPSLLLQAHDFPKLTSLRHLSCIDFFFRGKRVPCITPVIEAAPSLHKFKLEYDNLNKIEKYKLREVMRRVRGHPNQYLKEVEVVGFYGKEADAEIVTYLLKSAFMLEKIVIDTRPIKIGHPEAFETVQKMAKNVAHQLMQKQNQAGAEFVIL